MSLQPVLGNTVTVHHERSSANCGMPVDKHRIPFTNNVRWLGRDGSIVPFFFCTTSAASVNSSKVYS